MGLYYRFLSLFAFIGLFSCTVFSQRNPEMKAYEDSLTILHNKIQNAVNDSLKKEFNNHFKAVLLRSLSQPASFGYSYASLSNISKLTSPDKQFRIYTWNLPKGDGTHDYFGFIQMNPKGKEKTRIIELTDKSDSLPDPERKVLTPDKWFGAIYYRILLNEYNQAKVYTLLGWIGVDSQLTQKVIEVLVFDKQQNPQFGASIFRNTGSDNRCRILFKFSSSATMYLNYDQQYLPSKKKWNPSKKQFESESIKKFMIVSDELIPQDPTLEGQFQYYIPSSEVYNGFVFMNGTWTFVPNIDARNK